MVRLDARLVVDDLAAARELDPLDVRKRLPLRLAARPRRWRDDRAPQRRPLLDALPPLADAAAPRVAAARRAGRRGARRALARARLKALGFESEERGAGHLPPAHREPAGRGRALVSRRTTTSTARPPAASCPSPHLLREMEAAGTRWGILVSGDVWRLYSAEHPARATSFAELDLARLGDPAYFAALFSASALAPAGLAEAIERGSRDFAVGLGDRLRGRVYERVVPAIVARDLHELERLGEPPESRAELEGVYEATLVLLYRLLFVLYAESREYLPVEASAGYRTTRCAGDSTRSSPPSRRSASSTRTRATSGATSRRRSARSRAASASGACPPTTAVSSTTTRRRRPARSSPACARRTPASAGRSTSSRSTATTTTPAGSTTPTSTSATSATCTRGCSRSRPTAPARISPTTPPRTRTSQRPRATTSRSLRAPSICEGAAAAGRRRGATTRRRSSSATSSRRRSCPCTRSTSQRSAERATSGDEEKAARLLWDFRVCDPAMGSGHFLVDALDVLTDRIAAFLAERPLAPVRAVLNQLRETVQAQARDLPAGVLEQIRDVDLLKRVVLKRSIYGVDLNPMAVELAKLGTLARRVRARAAALLSRPQPAPREQPRRRRRRRGADVAAARRGDARGRLDRRAARRGRRAGQARGRAGRARLEDVEAAREAELQRREATSVLTRVYDRWTAESFGIPGARGRIAQLDTLEAEADAREAARDRGGAGVLPLAARVARGLPARPARLRRRARESALGQAQGREARLLSVLHSGAEVRQLGGRSASG